MTMNVKLFASIAACLASVAAGVASASASTLSGVTGPHAIATKSIHGNSRGPWQLMGGEGAAIGIGALIIGGVVLSEAARAEHRRNHGGDWDRCARSHRSFDRESGFYTDRDGARRQCRYLN